MSNKKARSEHSLDRKRLYDQVRQPQTDNADHRKADEINDTVFDLCLGKHPEGRDDIIHSKSDDKAEHHTNAFGRVQQLTDQYHRQHIRNRCDPSDDQTSEKLYPCVTGIFK